MLVVDSGPLVAAGSRTDRNHDQCVTFLMDVARPLIVPMLVVTEVAHLLERRSGLHAERAFAQSFRLGELVAEPVEPSDWERISELLDTYDDLRLGIVDASVVATCERLGVTRLATLDHRHFSVVRPRHCETLELVP